MRSQIWLNDVELHAAVPEALINKIEVLPVDIKNNFADKARGGRFLTGQNRSHITVKLTLQFRSGNNPVVRTQAIDKVNAWAFGGGWLRLSNRPGKRLRVSCTKLAGEGIIKSMAEAAEIEFTTTAVPYWQDIEQFSQSFSSGGVWEGLFIYTRFTAESPVKVVVTPTAGTLTWFMVGVANGTDYLNDITTIEVENISVPANYSIVIDYTDDDLLQISWDGGSLLDKITSYSADILRAAPNVQAAISCTADTTATCTATIYGRWL